MAPKAWELNSETSLEKMKDTLNYLFERDLKKLIDELNAYRKEENIWKINGEIKNSSGTLAFHLVGNLNHFIGAIMGKSGYERDRDAEFSARDISREELITMIQNTIQEINGAILQFPEDWFSRTYPLEVFGKPMTYELFTIHLVAHLNYHLGQVNYHRRLLDV